MEPTTIIATALALGAATGVKSIAERAVKDAYEGLKTLIKARYPGVGIERLEQKPDSEKRRGVIEEDLADVGADADEEILRRAKALLDATADLAPSEAPAVGVSLEDIKGASLTLEDIIATGTGVSVKSGEFQGDITIKGVRAGTERNLDPKVQRQ